jgi:hypothetical protein
VSIPLGSLRLDVNQMAEQIHDVERVEFTIAFYVPRADQIRLVNVVDLKGFCEIRVLNPFGDIRSFF